MTQEEYRELKEQRKREEEENMKLIRKIVTIGISALLTIIILFASICIVSPTQRGVKVTLGKAGNNVIAPGLVLKVPFVQSVKKYDLSPKQLEMNFSMGSDAAVTMDMQSVACNIVVYWTYDEARILDIVNGYSDSTIKSLVKDNTLGAVKEIIGKYSIYDIVEKQDEVTDKVRSGLINRLSSYPVTISNITINNWDWSEVFDQQIANTMAMAQQVKVAQQELEVTKQQSQKQVAEAEANRQKAEIEAQMKVVIAEQQAKADRAKAEGESEARKVKAEAEAYAKQKEADAEAYAKQKSGEAEASYYQSLVPYVDIIKTTRNLDIEEERAESWNGVEVSTYLPLTANGTLVSLK